MSSQPESRAPAGARVSTNASAHRLTIFSTSGGMVGACLTGISLIGVWSHIKQIETISEELLALDALLFLICSMLSFLSIRSPGHARRRRLLDRAADIIFLVGLTLMIVVCALMAWTMR